MFLKDMHDLMFVHNEKKNCDNWELAVVINLLVFWVVLMQEKIPE